MKAHATDYDAYMNVRHFGSLDGLRFICITAVIWHHLPLWHQLDSTLLSRGHVGVDFFFVLSGYLITTLLLREEARKGSFSLQGFYWRRVLRILPIYFFVVGVATVYAVAVRGETEYLALVPYYLLFLSNFLTEHIPFLDPTWSLAIEEQYYLLWPFLLLVLPRRWIKQVLLGLIGINLAGVLGAFTPLGITGFQLGYLDIKLSGTTYAPILMGSFVAIVLNERGGFEAFARVLSYRAAPWICFALLAAVLAYSPPILEGWPNLVVHSLMSAALISLVVREDNGMAAVLRLPPITRIGQISYGIYLYHLFALAIVSKGFSILGWTGWGWVFFLYYGLSILIAEISFRTLEAWFMRLRSTGPGRPSTYRT